VFIKKALTNIQRTAIDKNTLPLAVIAEKYSYGQERISELKTLLFSKRQRRREPSPAASVSGLG